MARFELWSLVWEINLSWVLDFKIYVSYTTLEFLQNFIGYGLSNFYRHVTWLHENLLYFFVEVSFSHKVPPSSRGLPTEFQVQHSRLRPWHDPLLYILSQLFNKLFIYILTLFISKKNISIFFQNIRKTTIIWGFVWFVSLFTLWKRNFYNLY